jgi:hypothetical protein
MLEMNGWIWIFGYKEGTNMILKMSKESNSFKNSIYAKFLSSTSKFATIF